MFLFFCFGKLDLFRKDIRIIQSIYWEQPAKMNRAMTQKQKRGRRQEYVFSTDVFNLQSKAILREFEVLSEIIIGRHNIKVRFMHAIVLMADTERKLQKLLDKVVNESKKKVLTTNCKKTQCMIVTKRDSLRSEL